jgi:hypothetical protein
MKINEEFLQQSDQLYNILNSDRLFKKLCWVINYENKQSVTNKISDETKLSIVTFGEDGALRMYGSEKSNGLTDFCKVKYFLCDNSTKKVEKIMMISNQFIILNSSSYHIYNWNPNVTGDKKVYIEIYE